MKKNNVVSYVLMLFMWISMSASLAMGQRTEVLNESFETAVNCPPDGWSSTTSVEAIVWAYSTGADGLGGSYSPSSIYDGAKAITFKPTASCVLALSTPAFDLSALSDVSLSFAYFIGEGSRPVKGSLKVYTSINGIDYTELLSSLTERNAWGLAALKLTSDTKYVKIEYTYNTGQYSKGGVWLDAIKIEGSPAVQYSDINEGFEGATCPAANWTLTADGSKNWICSDGTDLDAANAYKPEMVKEGSKYLTFIPDAQTACTVKIATPELKLGERAFLEFDVYIAGTAASTKLIVQTSTDGLSYEPMTIDMAKGSWQHIKANLPQATKYVRFDGVYTAGESIPAGVFIDRVKIFTQTGSVAVTEINESFESNLMPPDGWATSFEGTGDIKIYDTRTAETSQPTSTPSGTGNYIARYLGKGTLSSDQGSITTPLLDLSSYERSQVSFWFSNGDDGRKERRWHHILVEYTTDGTAYSPIYENNTVTYSAKASTSGQWQYYVATLPSETKNVRISFGNNGYNQDMASYNDTYIDDLYVGQEKCNSPMVISIDTILSRSAVVKWNTFGQESSYSIAYAPTSDFNISAATWANVDRPVEEKVMYKLKDLNPLTSYTVALKSSCGQNSAKEVVLSEFPSVRKFTTLPVCPSPINLECVGAPLATGVKISWEELGSANKWLVGSQNIEDPSAFEWEKAIKVEANTNKEFDLALSPANTFHAIEVRSVCGKDTSLAKEDSRIVVGLPPTCPAPKNVVVEDLAKDGFMLKWTAGGSEQAWNIKIVPLGGEATTYTSDQASYSFTGLMSGSVYMVSVQANCATTDKSVYSSDQRVITLCALITEETLPYNDGFEAAVTPFLSPCTDATSFGAGKIFRSTTGKTNGQNPYKGSTQMSVWGKKGTYGNYLVANDYLFLPEMQLQNGHKYELSFWYKGAVATGNDIDKIFNMEITAGSDIALENQKNISADTLKEIGVVEWTNYKMTYIPSVTQNYRIGLHVYSTSIDAVNTVLLIDELVFRRITDCAQPENVAIGSITATDAQITWVTSTSEESSPENYQIRYGKTISYGSSRKDTIVDGSVNIMKIKNLEPETGYTFQMRSICSENDTSSWSAQQTFTTALACPAPTSLVVSDITTNSMKITWEPGRSETSWQYAHTKGIAADTNSEFVKTVNEKEFIASSLQHSSTYSIAVRAVCGDKYSKWITKRASTNCAPFDVPYTQNFDSTLDKVFPPCMSTTDVKQNVYVKVEKDVQAGMLRAHSGYGFVYMISPNDFIFTPQIELQTGKSYAFSVWYNTSDTLSKIRLLYGAEKVGATMVQLAEAKITIVDKYEKLTARFTATADGPFYFGVYARSESLIGIDDIAIDPYCAEPTGLDVSELTTNSAKLAWSGVADSYIVKYRAVGASEYVSSTETALSKTLTNLESNTEYEWNIQGVCSNGTGSVVEGSHFKTRVVTCEAPTTLLASDITATTVHFKWHGTKDKYEVRYKTVAATAYRTDVILDTFCTIQGLVEVSAYEWAVRKVCTESNKSIWVEGERFTTLVNSCQTPIGLDATVNSTTVTLSWYGDPTKYSVRYKEKKASEFIYQTVNASKLTLNDLKAKTEYDWAVRGICAEGDSSQWATDKFTTGEVSIERNENAGFSIYNKEGRFMLRNASALMVNEISVVNIAGLQLCKAIVNQKCDYELPCQLPYGTYIVRVVSNGSVIVFKVFVQK